MIASSDESYIVRAIKLDRMPLKQTQSPNLIEAPRDWTAILHRYREPDHVRSMLEILITAVPFVLLWILMWASLGLSYWLSLIIAVPAAGFLVRLFMIQHDCGHGAFFRQRSANDWIGRAIGVLTLTPYDHWRHTHGIQAFRYLKWPA
jgi:acyl-lipid omega-6 desaturase (Delta-12 desaturase)